MTARGCSSSTGNTQNLPGLDGGGDPAARQPAKLHGPLHQLDIRGQHALPQQENWGNSFVFENHPRFLEKLCHTVKELDINPPYSVSG